MSVERATGKPLTGRKVLAIAVAFFGVIIVVNVFMAYSAVRTFPGLEVANSYVASQEFDARARAQRALGWDVSAALAPGGVRLVIRDESGALVAPTSIVARVGHPTNAAHDQVLSFAPDGEGLYAPVLLARGPWRLFINATAADGTDYSSRLEIMVR
ncbi:MAG: FixH family protein [Paracoccaceae bacterium]